MNSLQLFTSFRPKSNIFFRHSSFSKVDLIKLHNYTSKSLYGPVIKNKRSNVRRELEAPEKSSPKVLTIKEQESNYDSEIYWVVARRLNPILPKTNPENIKSKVLAKNKASTIRDSDIVKYSKLITANKVKDTSTNDKENFSQKSSSTENITANLNSPSIAKKPILLSDEELNSILDHPLQSEVVINSPIDLRSPALRNVPSVGKILQYTMPEAARNALMNWKLSKISELGEEGFEDLQKCEYIKIIKRLFNEDFEILANLRAGYTFHWSLQHYFQTKEIPLGLSK